ncbi:MAG: hypothetical protein GXO70_09460 [Acidobacteria bacterium]|nr:hypothetical protein [Acidobacteriota bacterium]
MKKILLFSLFMSCAMTVFSHEISCQLPHGASPQHAFSILQADFSLIAKQDLAFKQINCDAKAATISTESRTFKLKRKTPGIGEFPPLHRPKWRKETVQLKASLKDRILTVELNANAYNKRDKKWYPVQSTGRYEEIILESVLTEVLEGIQGMTMGSLTAKGNAGIVKLKNLRSFTITGAYVSFHDIKTLVIDLTDKKDATFKVTIPFLGPVNNICSAVKEFFSRFTTRDLKAEVPRVYDYYWAYATEGELMDGMHQNQVLAAIGEPDEKRTIRKGSEKWIYHIGKQARELTIVNGELHIPEIRTHSRNK